MSDLLIGHKHSSAAEDLRRARQWHDLPRTLAEARQLDIRRLPSHLQMRALRWQNTLQPLMMAWTDLTDLNAGDVLTETIWQYLVDDLDLLKTHVHDGTVGGGGTISGASLAYIDSEIVTPSAVASVIFSSIPATYDHLMIIHQVNPATDSVHYYCQFNGDTGANYAGGNNQLSLSANSGVLGNDANRPASYVSVIPHYAQTVFYKSMVTQYTCIDAGDANEGGVCNQSQWDSTVAINQIKLYMSAGNIQVGSSFYLYGIQQ